MATLPLIESQILPNEWRQLRWMRDMTSKSRQELDKMGHQHPYGAYSST